MTVISESVMRKFFFSGVFIRREPPRGVKVAVTLDSDGLFVYGFNVNVS